MTFSLKNVAKTRGDDLIFRSHIRLILPVLLLAPWDDNSLACQVVLLGSGYDVIALGNANVSNASTISGRLAGIGNVHLLSGSEVGTQTNDSLPTVYSGNTLVIDNSIVMNGNAIYGNQSLLTAATFDPGYGAISGEQCKHRTFFSNSVTQHFQNLSSALSNLSTTGTMTFKKRVS